MTEQTDTESGGSNETKTDSVETDANDTDANDSGSGVIDDEVTDSLARYERTIDHQIELLNAIDDKAQTVVQYTGVVLGLLVTGVSLVPRIDGVGFADIPRSATFTFIFGAIVLLAAIVGGMITYLSSVIKYGLGPNFGSSVAERRIRSPIYEEAILNSHADAVAENRSVINANAIRFRTTLEILILGIALLALSGLYLVLDAPLWGELCLGLVWTFLIGFVLSVYSHGRILSAGTEVSIHEPITAPSRGTRRNRGLDGRRRWACRRRNGEKFQGRHLDRRVTGSVL